MAYRQYTHCISKSDFDSFWNFGGKTQDPLTPLLVWGVLRAALWAFLGALAGAGIGFAAGGPFGAAVGGAVGGAFGLTEGFIDGFCDQWLNRRLICIEKDRCAVGRVAHIEYVRDKDWFEALFDNDTSLNLRMTPYALKDFPWDGGPDHDWNAMVSDGYSAADLIRRRFNDLAYTGYEGEQDNAPGNHPGGRWTLHCEFEGDGMTTLCAIARWLAVLTTITAPLWMVIGAIGGFFYYGIKNGIKAFKTCKKSCSIPILCDIVCFFAAVLAAIPAAIAGAVAGALGGPGLAAVLLSGIISEIFGMRHDGAFADAANDPASGTLELQDCIFLAGDLVYDAGHQDGWHELHPVKHLQKICFPPAGAILVNPALDPDDPCAPSDPSDPNCCPETRTSCATRFATPADRDEVQRLWDRWCEGYQTSQEGVVIAAQQDPENQWCLHPLIDGCSRTQEPTDHGSPVDPGFPHIR
jgi:hypothetical protein